jgi:hypothetical protein
MLKSVKVLSIATVLLLSIVMLVYSMIGGSNAGAAQSGKTTVFWLQTMDSCKQAIPGASFRLQGNGLSIDQGPTAGSKPLTIDPTSTCPDQRGNCVVSNQTGCVSWDVPVPTSGSKSYQIIELSSPQGYVPCLMYPECQNGPVTVTLTIDSRGVISALAHDVYPNGGVATWPETGKPYTGSDTDPVVVHNSSANKNESTPKPSVSPTPAPKSPTPTPTGLPGLPPTGSDPNN